MTDGWGYLLTALAIIFVGMPLLRRHYRAEPDTTAVNTGFFRQQVKAFQQQLDSGEIDQQQFDELYAEQQKLLLADAEDNARVQKAGSFSGGWVLIVALLLMPVAAFQLYQWLGASADLEITRLLEQRATEQNPQVSDRLQATVIEKIAQRLSANPQHVGYQVTQARLLTDAGEFQAAIQHYRQAMELLPDDMVVAAEYAQAAYFAEGNRFTPNIEAAMERVLANDPGNITVLGLQGIKAFSSGEYRQALISWQKALAGMNPASPEARALQSGISRVRQKLGEPLPGAKVRVELSPELQVQSQLQAQPQQVVFVYAIEANGSPMPLAIGRVLADELPVDLLLDDSMSMPGGRLISSVENIQLIARVSRTGNAAPASGDLEGRSSPIALTEAAKGVTLVIDKTIP